MERKKKGDKNSSDQAVCVQLLCLFCAFQREWKGKLYINNLNEVFYEKSF